MNPNPTHLKDITPEQRAEMREKARIKKEQNQQWALANLRTEWDDDHAWRELASRYGIRLPVWYMPASPKVIRKALKQLGRDTSWWKDVTGWSKLEDEQENNPKMNGVCAVGIILEAHDYDVKMGR